MPALSLASYKPVPSTLGDANAIASAMTAIEAVVNALDESNFVAGKIFDLAKLKQGGATLGQGLYWNATDWVAGYPRANPTNTTDFLRADGSFATPTYQQRILSQLAGNPLTAINNTVAETDCFGTPGSGISVAGGTLGTIKTIRVTLLGAYTNTSAASQGGTFRIYYGATSFAGSLNAAFFGSVSETDFPFKVVADIVALGATNAQRLYIVGSSGTSRVFGPSGATAAAAIDSTATQNVRVTVVNTAGANLTVRILSATVELIG